MSRLTAYSALDEKSIDINEATLSWPRPNVLSASAAVKLYPLANKIVFSRLFILAAITPETATPTQAADVNPPAGLPLRPDSTPQLRLVSASLSEFNVSQTNEPANFAPTGLASPISLVDITLDKT